MDILIKYKTSDLITLYNCTLVAIYVSDCILENWPRCHNYYVLFIFKFITYIPECIGTAISA